MRGRRLAVSKRKIILIFILMISVTAIAAVTLYLNPYLFRRAARETVWENHELTTADFDVIVVGAEPEGIAAALAAARNGMNTLLLESASAPGGLFTLGKLNYLDMCHGRDGTLLTRGFFDEFYSGVGGSGFDITEAQNFFMDVVDREPLLTFRTNSHLLAPVMDGGKVIGVRMLEQGVEFDRVEVMYTGKRFIDATADGDLAAMAGAPYTYGGEDVGEVDRKMGVTLVFELSDVGWTKIFLHLNLQRLRGLLSGTPVTVGARDKIAWGYDDEGLAYVPNDNMVRLRGLNITRQRNRSVLINALVVFDTDPLEADSYQLAVDRANAELEHLLPYLRENYAGFEKARLASTGSRLYVRETRHIVGEYQLTIDDVLENRDFWDKIAIGSYPADVQPSLTQPSGTVIGNPDRYAVPFRCLVPRNVDNLLIVGRSASFTSLAASSARVVPLGMACGQAAGTAAAQSIRDDISFREMSRDKDAVSRLQSTLKSQGAYLEDFTIIEPIMSHWAYDGMAALRRLGLIGGGYGNDYRLDQTAGRSYFRNLLYGVIRKLGNDLETVPIGDPLTNGAVIEAVASVYVSATAEEEIEVKRSHRENLELLSNAGLLDVNFRDLFENEDARPQAAEVTVLLANLYIHVSGSG